MKTKLLLGFLVLLIPLMGFDCVNDVIVVSLDLKPFNAVYVLTPGNNASPYTGGATVDPGDLYDRSYVLTGASVYDIKIQSVGPDLGTCSGTVTITTGTTTNTLFTYNGPWTGFNIPQSLLTSSYITRNNAGVQQLVAAVLNKQVVTFGGAASITAATVPNNCSLVMSAYVQAYGHL